MNTTIVSPVAIIFFLLSTSIYMYDSMWLSEKETEAYMRLHMNDRTMRSKIIDYIDNGRISKVAVDILEDFRIKMKNSRID